MSENQPRTVRIRPSWGNAGRTGRCYGTVDIGGRVWAIVVFPEEDEDPTLFKAEGLEVSESSWRLLTESQPTEDSNA